MKLFARVSFMFAVALLLSTNSANAADLITNGSFENGTWYGNYSWYTLPLGSSDLTGWTIGGSGVDWHNPAELSPAADGLMLVDLNLNGSGATGTLSQGFVTNPGDSYQLSFSLANVFFDSNENILNVTLNKSAYDFSQTQSIGQHQLLWGEKTVDFIADSNYTLLTFASNDANNYWGPLVDKVSVINTTPVPEPSALLLGLLGSIGAFFSRFRKK